MRGVIEGRGGRSLISVVMPAFNEGASLEESVREVVSGLRSDGRRFEVVVVENGSTDDTLAIARRLAEELPELVVLHRPEADYGLALRAGFLAAEGEVVVNFDVDYLDLDFLAKATALMEAPSPPAVVVGSKRSPGAVDTRPWPRRMVTAVFSLVLHRLFGLKVSDTHGIKALHRPSLVGVVEGCRFGTDLFDTEMVLRAERAGLAVTELPVEVVERRPSRSSIVRRIPRSLWGLARLRFALWREHGGRETPGA